jgi:hypothetical protein
MSIGRLASLDSTGKVVDPIRNPDPKLLMARKSAGMSKTADLFAGDMGYANITDSQNIGYYSFEFPVDALELPQSRAQELRFYRLAYDRDPIVGRGIDLHTEVPMSKITLERPKCTSEAFSDYVYDFYQGLVNTSQFFELLLHATREYWCIGEAFMYVEDSPDISPCPAAKRYVEKKTTDSERNDGRSTSFMESYNNSFGTDQLGLNFKHSAEEKKLAGILGFNPTHALDKRIMKIVAEVGPIVKELRKYEKDHLAAKTARLVQRVKTADDPIPDEGVQDADSPTPDADTGEVMGEEAPGGGVLDDLGGEEDFGGSGGGLKPSPMMGDGMSLGDDSMGMEPPPEDKETRDLKRYIRMLEKKKKLLEEMQSLQETRKNDFEVFSHLTNISYSGFDKIQLLPPEQIEIKKSKEFGAGTTVYYKPPDDAKQAYIENEETPDDVRDSLTQEGLIPLNGDPFNGSYIIHFARKKAPFEDHGRSILQRCMRTVIYREKLRQVQTTLASRNMTPKTLVVAPGIGGGELIALRAHIDEAKSDPDYTVVVNYDATWNEIGSEGRLLSLDAEWAHTGSDLAIGLGFSPDILNGEGLYSSARTQLEILSTTYVQYRDLVSYIVQELIFKPIAMKKGFYEIDMYGRPRWIFPSVTFGRMALRNSGDVYQMMFEMYQKGSLPVSYILELLEVDPETCRRQLESDLFSVNDSKFNAFLESLYGGIGNDDYLKNNTDLWDRIKKTLGLAEKDTEDADLEGSGEGL